MAKRKGGKEERRKKGKRRGERGRGCLGDVEKGRRRLKEKRSGLEGGGESTG
jgi:hypothetical protein